MNDLIAEHPDPARRWKNRRRMAWSALVAGLLYPAGATLMDPGVASAVTGPFYVFVTGVVGLYIGAATAETITNARARQ